MLSNGVRVAQVACDPGIVGPLSFTALLNNYALVLMAVHSLPAAGIDFVSLTQEVSFTQSNQRLCVDISILMDGVQELDESFSVELALRYAPFDIPLDTYTVTIVDTGEIAVCMYMYVAVLKYFPNAIIVFNTTHIPLHST